MAFLLLVSAVTSIASERESEGKSSKYAQETADNWRNQKAFALSLIDQMPESKLNYSPTDSIRTFAQLFKHIGTTRLVLETIFAQEDMVPKFPEFGKIESTPMTKAELKSFVSESYDQCIALFENMSDKELDQTYTFGFFPGGPVVKSYRAIITAIGVHVAHHRGQATIYLRMNGITPSPYQHYW